MIIEAQTYSAVTGNGGNLSGKDQLVNINGRSNGNLHYYHLLDFTIVNYSNYFTDCKELFCNFSQFFQEKGYKNRLNLQEYPFCCL